MHSDIFIPNVYSVSPKDAVSSVQCVMAHVGNATLRDLHLVEILLFHCAYLKKI